MTPLKAGQRKSVSWTHPSALRLAKSGDPVGIILNKARAVALKAQAEGWTGPPFDPVALAARLDLEVIPTQDIPDARTVAVGVRGSRIEFNPTRPKERIRYSIAHEIAHTFFPDHRDCVRHRIAKEKMQGDEWQLEMLCNLAAAELIMPTGSFSSLQSENLTIDNLMALRRKYEVSSEALLIRVVRLTEEPCAVFAVSPVLDASGTMRYRLDYVIESRAWPSEAPPIGGLLPVKTVIADCTAIGFTSVGDERWAKTGNVHVECVGIPSYPGETLPRVVGIVRPSSGKSRTFEKVKEIRGDALRPRGDGVRIIAHVVNDRAHRWGGGFALAVRKRYPDAQIDFSNWVHEDPARLCLGASRIFAIREDLFLFSMVAQEGYGPSRQPRIRYQQLEVCLEALVNAARHQGATVHVPRIGCGQAGGSWSIVGELVDHALCRQGVGVTVYDLPEEDREEQGVLFQAQK